MNYVENAIEPDKPGILRDRRRSMKPPNSSHPARPSGSSNLARAPSALIFSSRNMPSSLSRGRSRDEHTEPTRDALISNQKCNCNVRVTIGTVSIPG